MVFMLSREFDINKLFKKLLGVDAYNILLPNKSNLHPVHLNFSAFSKLGQFLVLNSLLSDFYIDETIMYEASNRLV